MSTLNEVWVGPEDPSNLDPSIELWYDPTETGPFVIHNVGSGRQFISSDLLPEGVR